MNKPMNRLRLTYSIADQHFGRTKSVGILNTSVQLFAALARRPEFESLCLLSNRTLSGLAAPGPGVRVEMHDVAIRGARGRIWWDQWGVYAAARRTGNAWLFLPKGFASFCRKGGVRQAIYVHDAVGDYYRRHFPSSVPWLERVYFERSFRAALRWGDLIVTNSAFTSAEVRRMAAVYGCAAPALCHAGIGFDRPAVRGLDKQPRLLVLASRWPHKRSALAVEFLERWRRAAGYAGGIEVVGSLPEGVALPAVSAWRHLARMPEEEFRRRLAEAQALVYFSAYEGFGMPPVEAVLAGTCPVYSALLATSEVMGGAGCSFSNDSFDSFASAMGRALEIPSAELEVWAGALLSRHRWADAARRVVEALESMAPG
jgi:glycosyltransferase involved in cell wall biosynthesis